MYDDQTAKLLKLAAGASFSFSARDRLKSMWENWSMMTNEIVNPFDEHFRKTNLDNKVIAAKVAQHRSCLSILTSIGFTPEGDSALIVGKGKRILNIEPFVVGRDCIDKWIDRNRYHIAAAGQKLKDEMG